MISIPDNNRYLHLLALPDLFQNVELFPPLSEIYKLLFLVKKARTAKMKEGQILQEHSSTIKTALSKTLQVT